MGLGALAGALFTASRRRPSYRLLTFVVLMFGASIITVAYAPSLSLVLVLLVPLGAASVTFIATANSLLQLHSTAAMRGRVMALWAIVFLGSTPVGAPLTGYLASHLGARTTLALAGVATLLTGIGAAVALRATRDRLRRAAGCGEDDVTPAISAERATSVRATLPVKSEA
jgi:MFS family permease